MGIKEINVRSCMNKSKITDYVINPYVGCLHGCKYCYAVFMKRFMDIHGEWGKFCYVKKNCCDLLKKEVIKNKPGHIWMSSVTDCYNPLERKYELTRKILKILLNYRKKFSIEVLTKSSLVERDFDLLQDMDSEVGCSLNTLDESVQKIIEPGASSPKERIRVLRKAKEKGIKVFGFISPVLPMTNLEELFKELQFCDYVWVELLNIKNSVVKRMEPIIRKCFPGCVEDWKFILENYEEYCENVREEVRRLEKKYGLKARVVVH